MRATVSETYGKRLQIIQMTNGLLLSGTQSRTRQACRREDCPLATWGCSGQLLDLRHDLWEQDMAASSMG
jgi:hypothetical protein